MLSHAHEKCCQHAHVVTRTQYSSRVYKKKIATSMQKTVATLIKKKKNTYPPKKSIPTLMKKESHIQKSVATL